MSAGESATERGITVFIRGLGEKLIYQFGVDSWTANPDEEPRFERWSDDQSDEFYNYLKRSNDANIPRFYSTSA